MAQILPNRKRWLLKAKFEAAPPTAASESKRESRKSANAVSMKKLGLHGCTRPNDRHRLGG
jgi:hypothetical protein